MVMVAIEDNYYMCLMSLGICCWCLVCTLGISLLYEYVPSFVIILGGVDCQQIFCSAGPLVGIKVQVQRASC